MDELIIFDRGQMQLAPNIEYHIIELERQAKAIKAKQDEMRAALLAEMEAKNIIKIEADVLTITYVAATDRETFDSKRLKKDRPDLYDEYVTMSKVKPSVRIKVG